MTPEKNSSYLRSLKCIGRLSLVLTLFFALPLSARTVTHLGSATFEKRFALPIDTVFCDDSFWQPKSGKNFCHLDASVKVGFDSGEFFVSVMNSYGFFPKLEKSIALAGGRRAVVKLMWSVLSESDDSPVENGIYYWGENTELTDADMTIVKGGIRRIVDEYNNDLPYRWVVRARDQLPSGKAPKVFAKKRVIPLDGEKCLANLVSTPDPDAPDWRVWKCKVEWAPSNSLFNLPSWTDGTGEPLRFVYEDGARVQSQLALKVNGFEYKIYEKGASLDQLKQQLKKHADLHGGEMWTYFISPEIHQESELQEEILGELRLKRVEFDFQKDFDLNVCDENWNVGDHWSGCEVKVELPDVPFGQLNRPGYRWTGCVAGVQGWDANEGDGDSETGINFSTQICGTKPQGYDALDANPMINSKETLSVRLNNNDFEHYFTFRQALPFIKHFLKTPRTITHQYFYLVPGTSKSF